MKKRTLMTAAAISLLGLSSMAMADIQKLSDYQCLHADGNFNLNWQTGAPKIAITKNADSSKITISEDDGCLVIKEEKQRFWDTSGNKAIDIDLSSSTLNEIVLDGRTNYHFSPIFSEHFNFKELGHGTGIFSSITTKSADFRIMGHEDLNVSGLFADRAIIKINGRSIGTITGKVSNLSISNFGKSQLDLTELSTQNSSIYNLGQTDLSLDVNRLIRIDNMGISNINYYGAPKVIKKNMGKLLLQPAGL
ncbi:MAG: GIN domain-containing protein [Francisellaceae bacterium]